MIIEKICTAERTERAVDTHCMTAGAEDTFKTVMYRCEKCGARGLIAMKKNDDPEEVLKRVGCDCEGVEIRC